MRNLTDTLLDLEERALRSLGETYSEELSDETQAGREGEHPTLGEIQDKLDDLEIQDFDDAMLYTKAYIKAIQDIRESEAARAIRTTQV